MAGSVTPPRAALLRSRSDPFDYQGFGRSIGQGVIVGANRPGQWAVKAIRLLRLLCQLASDESLKQPFQPGHALPEIGHVPSEIGHVPS